MSRKVSVVIPVFNEVATVGEVIERVLVVPFHKEIIVVDDGSTDGSSEVLGALASRYPDLVRVLTLPGNRGKGAALRAGFRKAAGEIIVVQDADLEYDPEDIPGLLAALDEPGVDIVYGSRILGRTRRGYAAFYVGGLAVSLAASLLFRTHLTDEPTGYKVFPRRLLERIDLKCTGFEFCAEFTAKTLGRGLTLREVPISYHARSVRQGKKVSWWDGVKAVFYLARYRAAR